MTPTVGIFSRSGDIEYAWLTGRLEKHHKVLPIYISNRNRHVLIQSLSQCQFAILYHTKNRGRINITDVTDSIYDDEINLLSDRLGPSKVFAIIDDLEDSSEETKNRILNSQPTLLGKTEGKVFLFTKEEKKNQQRLGDKVQPIIDLIQRGTFKARKPTEEPYRKRREENIPKPEQGKVKSRDTVPFLVVLALSGIMCQEMYRSPDGRNWFLASFWTVGAFRAYFRKPSQLFWFLPWIHSMFSWMETLVSAHNLYYRRSISNAVLPALWLPASLGLLRNNRRQSHLNQSVLEMMGYGLVLYTFWKGWEMRDTTNVSELLVQIVLCSPYTLVAL
ncbi:uncharacterized protein LOC144000406 [Lithobates pipiens]